MSGYPQDEYGDDGAGGGDAEQEAMLEYIWNAAKLEVDVGADGANATRASARGKGNVKDIVKWRKLGFESEDMRKEFEQTGMLGLECLVSTPGKPLGRRTDAVSSYFSDILCKRIHRALRSSCWSRIVARSRDGVRLRGPPTRLLRFFRVIGTSSLQDVGQSFCSSLLDKAESPIQCRLHFNYVPTILS